MNSSTRKGITHELLIAHGPPPAIRALEGVLEADPGVEVDALGVLQDGPGPGVLAVTEQAHIKGPELRVINDVLGHLGLFAVNPKYMPQIDRHLGELLATPL